MRKKHHKELKEIKEKLTKFKRANQYIMEKINEFEKIVENIERNIMRD